MRLLLILLFFVPACSSMDKFNMFYNKCEERCGAEEFMKLKIESINENFYCECGKIIKKGGK